MPRPHTAIRPVIFGTAGWAMGEPLRRTIVARRNNSPISDDESADGPSRTCRARFHEVRDLHEVRIPTRPLLHGSDYGSDWPANALEAPPEGSVFGVRCSVFGVRWAEKRCWVLSFECSGLVLRFECWCSAFGGRRSAVGVRERGVGC